MIVNAQEGGQYHPIMDGRLSGWCCAIKHLVDKGKADAVCGKCHACGVVDVVDKVVDGTLHTAHSLLKTACHLQPQRGN